MVTPRLFLLSRKENLAPTDAKSAYRTTTGLYQDVFILYLFSPPHNKNFYELKNAIAWESEGERKESRD